MTGVEYIPNLPNKPLVEAVVELHWGDSDGKDPLYPVLVGQMWERLRGKFPHRDRELMPEDIPPSLTFRRVRHRFRAKEEGWPVMQVGPGIATYNETTGYCWKGFKQGAEEVIRTVFALHSGGLRPVAVVLQYIDAWPLEGTSPVSFMSEMFHVNAQIPESLFIDGVVESRTSAFSFSQEVTSLKPRGRVGVRFNSGTRQGQPAMIWHTTLKTDEDPPSSFDGVSSWLEDAHQITSVWFRELTKGELYERFKRASG